MPAPRNIRNRSKKFSENVTKVRTAWGPAGPFRPPA